MRRNCLILAIGVLSILPACSHGQVRSWEKLIAPGLTYRMEADFGKPLNVHALRWTPASKAVTAASTLAGPSVFGDEEATKGRKTLEQMLAGSPAVAAINGDFFPWTGDPLGFMMSGGDLISRPWPKRSIFAWGPGGTRIGRAEFAGTVAAGTQQIAFSGINEESGGDMIVLNSPKAGVAVLKTEGVHLIVNSGDQPGNGRTIRGLSGKISADKEVRVAPGTLVLSGSGKGAEFLKSIEEGAEIKVSCSVKGLDLNGISEAISGGPTLIRDGKVSVETAQEGFDQKFGSDRHPRTALGFTALGDVWLVVVDGRQPGVSRGVSLTELADILLRLGCTQAMNLDGGGSSEMWTLGVPVSRTSDPTSRPVANGILLFPTQPLPVSPVEMVIQGRPRVSMGVFSAMKVVDSRGLEVPNSEVFWSAKGAAWIDQGGFLRGIKPGEATVRASVKGKVLEVTVTVEGLEDSAAPPF